MSEPKGMSEEFKSGEEYGRVQERKRTVAVVYEQAIKATPEVAFVLGQIVADLGLKDIYNEHAAEAASKRFGPRP